MLQISNVSKQYGDSSVLANVSLTVNRGDPLGLVGPNGCGKTTLLRIIAGEERPDSGSVHLNPPGLRLGYLEQGLRYHESDAVADLLQADQSELELAQAKVAELANSVAAAGKAEQTRLMDAYTKALTALEAATQRQTAAHDAETVLAGLGLASVPLDTPVAALSGGQKTRLGLARLLLERPTTLLLDEPTNHLDIQALEWLEEWLRRYRGAALIVSHDRTFLDRTVSAVLELATHTHTLTVYPGTYADYVKAKIRQQEKQWAAYRDQQERIARVQADARRLSGYAGSIERGTTDFATRKIAKGIARRATVQRHRLERELEKERVDKPTRSWQMKLEFTDTPPSGRDVIILEGVAAGYGGVPLFTNVTQVLRAGERVALVGPNGEGKTTLLRVISGQLEPQDGRVRLGANVKLGYLHQEQDDLDPTQTPFDTLQRSAPMSETTVRSFLYFFLFSGDDVFVPIGNLSFGERAVLMLARLVATGCNCLLLDEPINHLDIPSRARFEQAMVNFEARSWPWLTTATLSGSSPAASGPSPMGP
jgi:ATPase subunit of ABC transporter with duplicated ATPase domains